MVFAVRSWIDRILNDVLDLPAKVHCSVIGVFDLLMMQRTTIEYKGIANAVTEATIVTIEKGGVYAVDRIRATSASQSYTQINFYSGVSGSVGHSLKEQAAASPIDYEPSFPLVLHEGDTIKVNVTVSTGAGSCTILWRKLR